jgi:hypothetical protein
LNLESEAGRAEFVRDVLALANTLVSEPRYLVVGYEPTKLDFHTSLDSAITTDRLEDILNAWTMGAPPISLHRVEVAGGTAGVLAIDPDRSRLPYRASKASGQLDPANVYVRHGTHVERATDGEHEDLLAVARRSVRAGTGDEPRD